MELMFGSSDDEGDGSGVGFGATTTAAAATIPAVVIGGGGGSSSGGGATAAAVMPRLPPDAVRGSVVCAHVVGAAISLLLLLPPTPTPLHPGLGRRV